MMNVKTFVRIRPSLQAAYAWRIITMFSSDTTLRGPKRRTTGLDTTVYMRCARVHIRRLRRRRSGRFRLISGNFSSHDRRARGPAIRSLGSSVHERSTKETRRFVSIRNTEVYTYIYVCVRVCTTLRPMLCARAISHNARPTRVGARTQLNPTTIVVGPCGDSSTRGAIL